MGLPIPTKNRMNTTPIRVLLVDDSADDFQLTKHLFASSKKAPVQLEWISKGEEALPALMKGGFDVCLLDYNLAPANGLEILQEAVARNCPTPIIILTGVGSYGVDVRATELGAVDYLVKGEITIDQLERSVRYAISRRQMELEKQRLSEQLQEKLAHEVKVLHGLLPICSVCKKIRDDQGKWKQLEVYIRDHSEANFTHGVCPDCGERMLAALHSETSTPPTHPIKLKF